MGLTDLRGPNALGSDRLILGHGRHGELAAALSELLAARGFAPKDAALADLHCHLPPGGADLDETYMNAVTRSFYALGDRVLAGYRRLIRDLARAVPGDDFLFQAAPVVRFHPPARFPPTLRSATGRGTQFHCDILGGHPVTMINGWLALTPTFGTNALHLSSVGESVAILRQFAATRVPGHAGLAGTLGAFYAAQRNDRAFAERVAAACAPLAMKTGDLVLFDARCIHGGVENRESATRVSLDFRLLPFQDGVDGFEAGVAAAHPRWVRGDILHPQTARELAVV